MRVYISSHDVQAAGSLAWDLTASGHQVVSTWHWSVDRPARDDADGWKWEAAKNFEEIDGSDVLVLIGGADKYPGGKYVEAGYAAGREKVVINLGEVGNGMVHAFMAVATVGHLLSALTGLDKA